MSLQYSGHPLTHFYNEQFSEFIQHKRFRIGVYRSSFLLKNVKEANHPEELLEKVFVNTIALAKSKSGLRPEKFSVIIRSAILNQPIQIPYRNFLQNSATVIMNQFNRVEQSGREKGRPSLFSQPLHFEIVMGPSKEEATELAHLEQGSGCKRNIKHNINRRALIEVNNEDALCLFLAIELTRKYIKMNKRNLAERNRFFHLVNGKSAFYQQKRRNLSQSLQNEMRKSGLYIDENLTAYCVEEHVPIIQKYFDIKFPNMWRITVFGRYGRLRPIWKGPCVARYELPLFLDQQHFYGVRNLNVLLNVRNYCIDCECPYQSLFKHRGKCKSKCRKCLGKGYGFPCIDDPGYFRECAECNNSFKNQNCYEDHKKKNICSKFHRCVLCGLIYSPKRIHECDVIFCHHDLTYHHKDQPCFVQKIIPKNKDYQLIFYDFECTTHNAMLNENNETIYNHCVNCASALLLCSNCINDNDWLNPYTGKCKICGTGKKRIKTWIFSKKCPDPLDSFIRWLLYDVSNNQKYKIIAVAHYSGRYDLHLVLGGIYRLGGIAPKIIRSGNKIYELEIEKKKKICPEISFRDTFNWISLSLAELPNALELGPSVEDKMFFPHGYNKNENLDLILETLPPVCDYFPESFNLKKRKHFEEFYRNNYSTKFCLRDQLKIYCENDVSLLAHALIKFRKMFKGLAPDFEHEDDIIANSLTIASACIRHYCINYLKEREVAIIPELGYHKKDLQSQKALKFMKWYAQKYNHPVRHRDNNVGGEYRLLIPSTGEIFRLDGFIERKPYDRDICIEFNGCAYHGHSCLYQPDEICLNGKTSEKNLEEVRRRKDLIESQGLEVRIFWECDVERMLEEDLEMQSFYEKILDTGPLIPRDGFFGGRTGPLCLKCDLEELGADYLEKYKISYYDVVSLYPSVNFYTEYPLGHPRVEVFDQLAQTVNWTKPEDYKYRGLLKLFIIPPKNLYVPVIPKKINEKLMFTLCYACAEKYGKGEACIPPYSNEIGELFCTHDDDERGFITTITDIELNLALSKNYRVTRLFSVYHWDKWTKNLFKPYVKQFMKIKIQASGWPESVLYPNDPNLEEIRKMEYIEKNRIEYGISLEPTEMKRNEGLRYISKICNNSMWGRWSLRNNLGRDLITDSPIELHRLLNNPKLEIGALQMISDDLVSVPYSNKRDFIQSHNKHNIMLAIVTTASARARLYEFMDKVYHTPGFKILYTDTDSLIFVHPRNKFPPFEVGSMLGQMQMEYPDREILAFYSGGCKQYGLKLQNITTGDVDHVLKFRGITLNTSNEDEFNFATFQGMVNNYIMCQPIELPRIQFRPNYLLGRVVTQQTYTSYAPIYDKGLVDIANFNIYPFGYTGEPIPDIQQISRGM